MISLQLAPGELPSMLLPLSAPLQGCSLNLTGCSVLAQITPPPADKKEKGVIPLASETPEHQPTPVGSGLPQHKLLCQPSPHPPAAFMMPLLIQKVHQTLHREDCLRKT